ncbi:hypothetical protein Tco_0967711 [Tanacetum coccineum]
MSAKVIDEDEVIPEDETLELIEEDAEEYAYHVQQAQNYLENQMVWKSRQEDLKRPKPDALVFYGPQRNPNEPPRIVEIIKVTTDQQYGLDYMERIVVMRENDKPDSFSEADFKYLNKNDIEDMYYLCLNTKINRENKLLNSLLMFIRTCVIWERVHDFQLGIESYLIKINLSAPTMTFCDIEACDPFSIVDKPTTGLIYLNIKNEKRFMDLEKLSKFCNATLEKVLKEVKMKIFETEFLKKAQLLGNLDHKIMKAYEREIEKRLKHRKHMRRYGYSSVGRFDVFFRDQLLMFRQHQDESLYDSWTRFKDIIRKVPNHGLSIWTLIKIFLKHLNSLSRHIINLTAEGDLRKFSDIGAWDNMVRVQELQALRVPHKPYRHLRNTHRPCYLEEVEKTLGTPIEVEPLNETKLDKVGLNCNHNTPLSSREVPSFDGPEPQPLLNSSSLDVSLGDVIGPEPPIKPHSPDSSRKKVVDYLTNQTSPSPHVSHPKGVYSYCNPGIDDPKRHYRFKPGLLGKSISLGVNVSNWEMFDDDWGLESKKVSPLGEELSLFDRPNEVERGRILETHRLEYIFQQQISQRIDPSHHDGMYRYYHPHLNSSVGEPSPLSVK